MALEQVSVTDCMEVLFEACSIARPYFHSEINVTAKKDESPLTEADTRINEFLRKALFRISPSSGWLSEESVDSSQRLSCDSVWIVDPLDGTKEFVQGIPEFAISIALVERHRVVLGGVANPATLEAAVASVDGNVLFCGLPQKVVKLCELRESHASVSRSEIQNGSVTPFLGLVGTASAVGSVAYKLLRVAAGLEDLTFSVQPKNEWDICGGIGLLAATGKTYRRFDGKPNLFNQEKTLIKCGAVAGPPLLVECFLAAYTGQRKPECLS